MARSLHHRSDLPFRNCELTNHRDWPASFAEPWAQDHNRSLRQRRRFVARLAQQRGKVDGDQHLIVSNMTHRSRDWEFENPSLTLLPMTPTTASPLAIMPGPKMGPRPPDFDEELIRQSPTFVKWTQLQAGQKLRYACREFIKDHQDDEERLMRRIMIARRNNIRDHEVLKKARKETRPPEAQRRRRPATSFSDQQVEHEMDVGAVEATRSYRSWLELPNGAEFVYNQKYVKGKEGHDWLLRKNIWRRMRYRRENKKMVETLKIDRRDISLSASSSVAGGESTTKGASGEAINNESSLEGLPVETAASAVENLPPPSKRTKTEADDADHAVAAAAAAADLHLADQAAVEAAVAAAESFGKAEMDSMSMVNNPLDSAALDAAAKLAAAQRLDEQEELYMKDANVMAEEVEEV